MNSVKPIYNQTQIENRAHYNALHYWYRSLLGLEGRMLYACIQREMRKIRVIHD